MINLKRFLEDRKLIKVFVRYDGKSFTMQYDGKVKVYRGTPEQFSKFLMKIKACDNQTSPRSKRQSTYMKMVNDIINRIDNVIWVWDYIINKYADHYYEN